MCFRLERAEDWGLRLQDYPKFSILISQFSQEVPPKAILDLGFVDGIVFPRGSSPSPVGT
ncbi:MAG: hypothetical protein ACD_2C00144G0007 [uncultured bacterium (gcode 4)]|uniref:Uncharacterized protein n=1 Tax=uncultured bacterium (gcode 4) TaxID=1234023 RepID=K2G5M5_9BACT|nr:MAG: hypothetical protein ACD_2C00144G0007 [uncultured bacterium (gcode 4)]